MQPLFDPADFRIPSGVTHVCAGGESAPLRSHDAAALRYLHDKGLGMPGRGAQEAEIEACRAGIARLWQVPQGDIGFVANVAEGVSMVADSIEWQDGDSICIDAHEYPSVVGPFGLRQRPAIRLLQSQGQDSDRLAACVRPGTRLIAVSYVSYLTGERVDLGRLRAAADRVGALLLVDYTQASGSLPIDASIADFAFSACYKWMLGVTGVAIACWNRVRQPSWAPCSAGWHSFAPGHQGWSSMPPLLPDAMRFTRGNPAHMPLYVLNNALSYLAGFDAAAVQRHVQSLTRALIERLDRLAVPVMTPADPARHGASVCIASPRAQQIVEALQQRGVYAWNGHGRIRISFHGYNGSRDVERVADALAEQVG